MAIILTIQPTDDIQNYLDILEENGGGILNLNPTETFFPGADIVIPSNVTINGNGGTIDFEGGAFQMKVLGTDSYSSGTISATYGSTTVTGSGTSWISGMVGRSILIGDYWYPISAVSDGTHLTIDSKFIGTNLSGDTYVIANTVNGVTIENLTLQNASGTLFKFKYVNGLTMNSFNCFDANQGIDGRDSGTALFGGNSNVDSCVVGIVYNNVPFAVFDLVGVFNISGGAAIDLTRVSNTAIGTISIQGINGVGMKFTNCYDLGLINYAYIGCASHGIEFVSGNRDMNVSGGYIDGCGGDGIKFTATSDSCQIYGNSIINSGGYGINIAAVTDDDNIISVNNLKNNSAGNVNNIGTGTLIRSNKGVADN